MLSPCYNVKETLSLREAKRKKSHYSVRLIICDSATRHLVRLMTQVKKKISLHPPRYQGCISSCREFYAEFNAKCCQSGNLCRKFVNMIL